MQDFSLRNQPKPFKLVNTLTGEINKIVYISVSDAWTMSYAYAINGSPMRYRPAWK